MRDAAPTSTRGTRARRNVLLTAIYLLLMAIVLVSLAQGVRNALDRSQDLQYSGAKILLQGENPYTVWLSNDHHPAFLLSQAPNYAPVLLYALRPLAMLDWAGAKALWAALNVSLALFVAYSLFRSQRVNGVQIACIMPLLFLSSGPVRNCIGNGQHSLLILVCMLAALGLRKRPLAASLFLTLAITKYSIGTFLWASMAGGRRYLIIGLAAVLTAGGFLILAGQTSTRIRPALVMSMLRVGDSSVFLRPLLASLKSVGGHDSLLCLAALGLLLSFIAARQLALSKHAGSVSIDPALAVISMSTCLAFSPHLNYDNVLLVLPLATGLRWASLPLVDKMTYGALLAYEWNFSVLVDRLSRPEVMWLSDLCVDLALTYLLFRAFRGFYCSPESPAISATV